MFAGSKEEPGYDSMLQTDGAVCAERLQVQKKECAAMYQEQ